DLKSRYFDPLQTTSLSPISGLAERLSISERSTKMIEDPETGDLNIILSPTQYEFVTDDAHIVQIIGPFGEGKTVAGIVGLIIHAARCGRNIRAAIIRDTFQNIKISTKRDMEEYLGSQVRFTDNGRSAIIYSDPQVDLDLFGIDDQASMSKLQGPQYACIWLEEPAPVIEKANAGLPKDVFNFALTRASRQRDTILRVQITQNPADESHWSAKLAEEPDEYMTVIDENTKEVTSIIKHVYRIKPGENRFLSSLSRAAVKAAFKDDPEKWARYVEGKEASISLGKKVTPGYNPLVHFSPKILPVFPGDGIQMWDGWGHPCCILAQWQPVGLGEAKQLIIHDVLTDEGIGTKELIQEQIFPILNSPKWKNKIKNWQAIGDPSMANMDQSSIRSSARREIEDAFQTKFQLGPKDWPPRREPLNHALKEMLADGKPSILLSRSAVKLHRALKGGWHYKVDNSGNVIGDKPVQNSEESHPGNAFSYGIALLKPYSPRKEFEKKMDNAREKRILSYGSSFRAPDSTAVPQRTGMIIRSNVSLNKR
ncbi:MAG: hypothetical protein L7F78_14195, partial [Syntrophales bacterium LBB04]|nr:hypothetical protein [Syntrophales bacterium LBB04]